MGGAEGLSLTWSSSTQLGLQARLWAAGLRLMGSLMSSVGGFSGWLAFSCPEIAWLSAAEPQGGLLVAVGWPGLQWLLGVMLPCGVLLGRALEGELGPAALRSPRIRAVFLNAAA